MIMIKNQVPSTHPVHQYNARNNLSNYLPRYKKYNLSVYRFITELMFSQKKQHVKYLGMFRLLYRRIEQPPFMNSVKKNDAI